MQNTLKLWLAACAVALGACTAILNQSADQCSKDADCASFGTGFTCSAGLCKGPGGGASSGDNGGSSGASSGDNGGSSGIIGPDGSVCTPTPNKTTNADFYNEPCTGSTCVPFDNCARLGLCNGAALPALVTPPDGGV